MKLNFIDFAKLELNFSGETKLLQIKKRQIISLKRKFALRSFILDFKLFAKDSYNILFLLDVELE